MKARQHSSSLGHRILPLAFLLPLVACAPSPQVGLDNENRVFTPDPMLPLKISLTTPLISWKRYEKRRQDKMIESLERIRKMKLSRDVYEIVDRGLRDS